MEHLHRRDRHVAITAEEIGDLRFIPASSQLRQGHRILSQDPGIQSPEDKIVYPGSWILDAGALDAEREILDSAPKSWIQNRGNRNCTCHLSAVRNIYTSTTKKRYLMVQKWYEQGLEVVSVV